MPQAELTTGQNLDIQLDSIGRLYQPGDVITGRVVRRVHAVSPQATVSIRLLGRAKSKIVVTRHHGNSTSHSSYRARYNFFEPGSMQTGQQLHQGPIHIPPAGSPASWEFAIEIPTTPHPQAVTSEFKNPEASFLPLGTEDIARYLLPASFATSGRRRNTRFDAYVEYHLEATLQQQGSHGESTTATLPLPMRAPPMPYPLADFDLRRRAWQAAVSTYRLVPGMENAELTFRQKSQKFFGSSKVPLFAFALEYESPSVIQLGSPAPIPFRVRAVPDPRRTSEVLQGAPQAVVLSSVQLVLKADTAVVAPGIWGTHSGDDTVKHYIMLPVAAAGTRTTDTPGVADLKMPSDGNGANDTAGPNCKEPHGASAHGGEKSQAIRPRDEQGGPAGPRAGYQHGEPSTEAQQAGDPTAGPATSEPSSALPTYQPRRHADNPPTSDEAPPPAYQAPEDTGERGPLVIPSSWAPEAPWLDVGAAVGLRLHGSGATALGRPVAVGFREPVCPEFTTYCIRHSHRLKWRLSIVVAGETASFEGEGPVAIVGAAGPA